MTEYSYSDLVKMQDQAIRRVREMQERARLTLRDDPTPDRLPENDEKNNADENGKNTDTDELSSKSHSQVQENKIENRQSANGEKCENAVACNEKSKNSQPPKSRPLFALDSDRALLLPLLMLLGKEGADDVLMFALLYILA